MTTDQKPAVEIIDNVDPCALNDELRELVQCMGVDLYGVASAQRYVDEFPDKPSPMGFMRDAKSLIVLGIQFEPSTVATVLHPHLAGMRDYTPEQIADPYSIEQPANARRFFLFDERTVLVHEMTHISYRIARHLRLNGYRSFHTPVVKQNGGPLKTPFMHMPAIYLAGMGTLGLNCCIITPEVGPRALFTTVITDAPLPAGEPMEEEVCTKCGLCVEKCPKGVIDGVGWKNAGACDCCRTCIAVCPVGKDAKLVRSYPG